VVFGGLGGVFRTMPSLGAGRVLPSRVISADMGWRRTRQEKRGVHLPTVSRTVRLVKRIARASTSGRSQGDRVPWIAQSAPRSTPPRPSAEETRHRHCGRRLTDNKLGGSSAFSRSGSNGESIDDFFSPEIDSQSVEPNGVPYPFDDAWK
jgi:hypothetical protein